jgi:putative membrane protein
MLAWLALAEPDPRVYFAAERTLLAWVRSGVAVIGLGFVVARFGLFLRLVSPNPQQADVGRVELSSLLGCALAIVGGVLTALAALQFKLFLRELSGEELPRSRLGSWLALVLALSVATVGVSLGVYLLA